jgi:hypothetical protein
MLQWLHRLAQAHRDRRTSLSNLLGWAVKMEICDETEQAVTAPQCCSPFAQCCPWHAKRLLWSVLLEICSETRTASHRIAPHRIASHPFADTP